MKYLKHTLTKLGSLADIDSRIVSTDLNEVWITREAAYLIDESIDQSKEEL